MNLWEIVDLDDTSVLSGYLDDHPDAIRRALHAVARNGHLDLLEHVLRHRPDQRALDASLALVAARPGGAPLVSALLAAGASANADDRLPLLDAIRGGIAENVAVLLEAGADPNAIPDWELRRPRDVAEDLGDEAVISLLVERGARRISTDEPGIVQAAQKLAADARTAWKPVIEYGETATADNPSRFGGTPWLLRDEAWPSCAECDEPLTFFAQVDLDHLPDAARDTFGPGLLQLFYCGQCEPNDPTGELIRVVDLADRIEAEEPPEHVEALPLHLIIGWDREVRDYPLYSIEYGSDVESLTPPEREARWRLCRRGDKLGGWPNWIHDVKDYPSCPDGDHLMDRMVLQIFGDSEVTEWREGAYNGVGYVLQCPWHHDQVTLVWDCP